MDWAPGGGGGLLSGRQCYIGDPWEGEADRVGPYQTRTGQVGPAGRLIYHNHPPLVASRSLYSVRNKFFLSPPSRYCAICGHTEGQ